tara:strand:+ start:1181 stop:2299 length:1119 start_codon:yes stop_codon:yes gene_type:complete
MPSFKHIVKTPYKSTFRSKKVEAQFDLTPGDELVKDWSVNIPIEDMEWNIGVIVGASGSGKTSIGKVAFTEENYVEEYTDWDHDSSIINNFPAHLTVDEITRVLSSVGFSSPPNWLQPYRTLSNGQKFRVNMARVLFDSRDICVVDEYTSVVDRTVAQIGSSAIAKTARKLNKKIVLLSCHYDILEWLEPDWIYRVDSGEFQRGSLRRPDINIQIQRCHSSAWRIFREHHYLSHGLISHSECYMALVNGQPAGFFAYIYDRFGKRKNIVRGHRSVVLPDYQGIGVGAICTTQLAKYFSEKGYIVKMITSHPAFIHSRMKNPDYRLCNDVDYVVNKGITQLTKTSIKSFGRVTATFQYVGHRKDLKMEENMLT